MLVKLGIFPHFRGEHLKKMKFHHLVHIVSSRCCLMLQFFFTNPGVRWTLRVEGLIGSSSAPPTIYQQGNHRISSYSPMMEKKQQTHHLQKPTKNSSMMEKLEVPHLRLPQFFSCFRFQAVHGLVVNISWVLPPIFCCWRTSLRGDRSLLPGCSTKQPRNTAPSS